jgi:cytochrome c oxidase cbb3-type subunit 4
MDINLLRALATVFVFVAFIAICVWAYSGKRKKRFDEAANLPFADEQPDRKPAEKNESKGER